MGQANQQFYRDSAYVIRKHLRQELKLQDGQHYRVASAYSGPHVLTFFLQVNPRFAPQISRLTEHLSMALRLPRGVSVLVSRGSGGLLEVQIPKPGGIDANGRPVGLHSIVPADRLPMWRQKAIPVGYLMNAHIAGVSFADPLTPHCLIAGATGGGKSNLLRLMAWSLARQNDPSNVGMVFIETIKGGETWRPLENSAHLAYPVIKDEGTAFKFLSWLVAEITQRGIERRKTPALFVFIDELQELLALPHLVGPISKIVATGREWGVHVIAATQNPVIAQLQDLTIKRNMSMRFVFHTDSPDAARAATGQKNSGAERLTGSGDALLVEPQGIGRVAVAYVKDDTLATLPRREVVTPTVEIDGFEDVNLLPDMPTASGRKGQPILPEPNEIGYALALSPAINSLQDAFHCGSDRAKRIKVFAERVAQTMSDLGYKVVKTMPELLED